MKRASLFKSIILFVVVVIPLALFAVSAFAAGPTGTGPNDALMVPTGTTTIDPGKTLWYYFDYLVDTTSRGARGRSSRLPAQVAVDANGARGLAFAVYTPDQAANWVSDPTTAPIGRGTPYTDTSDGEVTHDLYWAGGFNISGRYLVAVTNNGANPVAFTMAVTGDNVNLYPAAAPTATPTLLVPFTVTPVPTGTLTGRVVFENSTGGEIWTVNGDGSNLTRVSRGIDPTWSPDGKKILFARWDNSNPGVFIANADGSNEQLLFAAPRIRWPRMSPDGKYVVFAQDKSKSDLKTIWKLGLVEVATGKLFEPQCSDLCYVPSWMPDSATIVYTDPNIGILKTNAFSGAPALIGPSGRWWDASANISRPIVNWPPMQDTELSPDGQRMAFSMQAHDRWELNVMNADGSGQTGITNPDPILYILMGVVDHNVAPTWSPDGQQILFLSDRNGKWEFFVTDPNGGNVKQVLKNVTDLIKIDFGYNNERIMDWTK